MFTYPLNTKFEKFNLLEFSIRRIITSNDDIILNVALNVIITSVS